MPGSASYTVGDIGITVVSDGTMRLDGGAVFGLVPRVMWEPVVGLEHIDHEHRIELGLNCLVVRTGDQVLLLETGMGNKLTGAMRDKVFPGDHGHLLENLAAAGLAPGDITAVANTHLHADHCGWNTIERDGALVPTFPNARYFIQAAEYEAATHPNARTRATYVADNFVPLEASGQLELVSGEREIVPGVQFVEAPGHSEGHAVIAFASGGEHGLYVGDLVQHEAQLERDAWVSAFDVLPMTSLETKTRLAEQAMREGSLVIATHAAFPGAGRLVQQGTRRAFVPA